MNKKLLIFLLIGLSLVGCNNKTEIEEETTIKETIKEEKVEDETTSKYIKNPNKKETTLEEESPVESVEVNKDEINDNRDLDYKTYAEYQMQKAIDNDIVAIFHIKELGDIKVKLFEEAAPKAVENFVTHSKEGYYNGLTFHRVINDYIIQGGDPKGDSTGGESIWGEGFENECTVELVPYRGALCMANRGTENSNTSQFFIVSAKTNNEVEQELINNNYPLSFIEQYKIYGGAPWLYQSYTVFGQVMEGMEIVEKIEEVETDENDKPKTDIIIESIDIVGEISEEN